MVDKANAPNWEAIRQEYIETDISMRALAEKHGVNPNTLQSHAKSEKWSELRKKAARKANAKLVQKAASKRARIADLREDYGVEVMEMALDGIRELKKTKSTRVVREFVSTPKKKDLPPVKVTEERDLSKYVNAVASVMRILGLDAATELSHERFELQKQQGGGADDTDAFNANMVSIAELINHPMPDRTMEQVEAPDPEDMPKDGEGT